MSVLLTLSCGVDDQESNARAQKDWERNAPLCDGFPAKGGCDDGDAILFNGLLCASGIDLACDTVRDSQDADGRFWRSPRRARNGNFGKPNSFSRDQAMGALHYLAASKDREAAVRWLDWIEENRACALEGLSNTCWLKAPHRYCTDDESKQCTITPGMWSLMDVVWTDLGLEPNAMMKASRGADLVITPLEVTFAEAGYQLHLKGVQTYLRQLLGESGLKSAQIAEDLLNRIPSNPFFQFLAGVDPEQIMIRLKNFCPTANPRSRLNQWAWERSDPLAAAKNSMIWDCIFMSRLL